MSLFQDLDAYICNALPKPEGTAHTSSDVHATLKTMQASLDRIENQGKATGNTSSYAAVTAKGCVFGSTNGQATSENTLKEKRKAKEITIRVEDPKEAEELKEKNSRDILLTVQAAEAEVTGVQRLSSSNVRFHTRLQDSRDTLQNNASWTKVVAALAKVQQHT